MYTLSELIARMPGGDWIGHQWVDEERSKVILEWDEQWDDGYTFGREILEAAIREYGPISIDDEGRQYLTVPLLVAEMLEFWSDHEQFGYWAEHEAASPGTSYTTQRQNQTKGGPRGS